MLGPFTSASNGLAGRALGVVRATWLFLTIGSVWAFAVVYIFGDGLSFARLQSIPAYLFIPGLVNLFLIAVQIRLVNVLGTTLTQGSLFAGQMVASLFLDHVGFAGLQALPATAGRIVGVALLLTGVYLLAAGARQEGNPSPVPEFPEGGDPKAATWRTNGPAVVLGLLVGAVLSTSMALNASLGTIVGPITSTGLFLLPGAVILGVYLLVQRGLKRERGTSAKPSVLYFVPGTLNVLGVTGSIALIPVVGVQLMTGTTFSAGVLTGLLVVDRLGMFGLPQRPVSLHRVAATVALVVGVAVSMIFRQG